MDRQDYLHLDKRDTKLSVGCLVLVEPEDVALLFDHRA
jgi:hypothetical protein